MNTSRPLEILGVALVCGSALLAGLFATLLTPLRVGTVLVPVSVLVAIAANVILPRLGRRLVDTTLAGALPYLCWLAAVIVLGLVPRPEGDVLLPGGGAQQWVSVGTLLAGAAAGAVTLGMIGGARRGPVRRR